MRLSAVLAFTALAASLPHAHASFPFPFTIHALPELTSPVGATCRKFLAADKIHKTCFFVPPTAATPEMIKSSFVEMCSKPICAQSDVDAFAKEMTKACSTDIKLHPAVKNLDDYISDLKIVFTWYTTFREVDCYVDTDKELVTYKLREAFARATWGGPRPTETEICTKGNRYAVGTIIATMEKNPAKFEPHVYVDGVKNFWRLECGPGYDTDLYPVHGPPYPDLQKKMTVMPSIPDTTKNTSPKKSAAKLENGLTSDVAVSNVAGDDKDVSFRNNMKNTKDSTLSSISKGLTWVFGQIFYPPHSDGDIPLEEEAPSNSDTLNSNKDTIAENPTASDGIELAETASPEESANKLENVLTSDVAQPTVSDDENDITPETGVKNTADNTPLNAKEGRIPTVKSASNSETFTHSKTNRKKSAEDDKPKIQNIKEAPGNVKSQPTSAEAPTAKSGNTAIGSSGIEDPSEGDGQLKNAVEIQSEKDENSEDEKLPDHQSGDAVLSTLPTFTMFLTIIGFAIQLQ